MTTYHDNLNRRNKVNLNEILPPNTVNNLSSIDKQYLEYTVEQLYTTFEIGSLPTTCDKCKAQIGKDSGYTLKNIRLRFMKNVDSFTGEIYIKPVLEVMCPVCFNWIELTPLTEYQKNEVLWYIPAAIYDFTQFYDSELTTENTENNINKISINIEDMKKYPTQYVRIGELKLELNSSEGVPDSDDDVF